MTDPIEKVEGDARMETHLLYGRSQGLGEQSIRLRHEGRYEEAMKAAREAVELTCAFLFSAFVAEYVRRPSMMLSDALVTLSSCLGLTGRHEEALKTARAAVGVYRSHMSLGQLGEALSALNRHEEALEVARETLTRGGSSSTLALRLNKAGHPEEALEILLGNLDAARARRRDEGSTRFTDNGLALCLLDLSQFLREQRRHAESLEAAEEAVELLRPLTNHSSEELEYHLVRGLNSVGIGLAMTGRSNEAPAPFYEAVKLLRPRAQQTPGSAGHKLLSVLDNLNKVLVRTGWTSEGRRIEREAADLRRLLTQANTR